MVNESCLLISSPNLFEEVFTVLKAVYKNNDPTLVLDETAQTERR